VVATAEEASQYLRVPIALPVLPLSSSLDCLTTPAWRAAASTDPECSSPLDALLPPAAEASARWPACKPAVGHRTKLIAVIRAGLEPRRKDATRRPLRRSNTRASVPFADAVASRRPSCEAVMHTTGELCAVMIVLIFIVDASYTATSPVRALDGITNQVSLPHGTTNPSPNGLSSVLRASRSSAVPGFTTWHASLYTANSVVAQAETRSTGRGKRSSAISRTCPLVSMLRNDTEPWHGSCGFCL